MKKLLLLFVISFFSVSIFGQSEEIFTRKGKFIVETGTSFFSGFGSSTGGSVLFNDGTTLSQFGIDAGTFISEDFAIKIKFGILGGTGSTLTNFGVSGKYYIGGVAPFEIDLGGVAGFGSTEFLGGAHIGYAIELASNIYLEPKGGIIYSEESTIGSLKFTFAMIF